MRIKSVVLNVVVYCLLLLFSPIVMAGGYVWYVGIRFEPTSSLVQGIPVSSLDQSWILARCLTKNDIPQKEVEDFEKYNEPFGVSFDKEGDFNGDGRPDRAVVGVYKDKSAGSGRFLLILTRQQKKWVKLALFKRPGRPGFSILGKSRKDALVWDFCMECDDVSIIKWEENHFVLIVCDDEIP